MAAAAVRTDKSYASAFTPVIPDVSQPKSASPAEALQVLSHVRVMSSASGSPHLPSDAPFIASVVKDRSKEEKKPLIKSSSEAGVSKPKTVGMMRDKILAHLKPKYEPVAKLEVYFRNMNKGMDAGFPEIEPIWTSVSELSREEAEYARALETLSKANLSSLGLKIIGGLCAKARIQAYKCAFQAALRDTETRSVELDFLSLQSLLVKWKAKPMDTNLELLQTVLKLAGYNVLKERKAIFDWLSGPILNEIVMSLEEHYAYLMLVNSFTVETEKADQKKGIRDKI